MLSKLAYKIKFKVRFWVYLDYFRTKDVFNNSYNAGKYLFAYIFVENPKSTFFANDFFLLHF